MRARRLLPAAVVLAVVAAGPGHAATAPQVVAPAPPLAPAVVGDVLRSLPAGFAGDPAPDVTQRWQRCSRLIDHERVEEPAHLWRLGDAPAATVAVDVLGRSAATYDATSHVSVPGAAVGEPDRAIELDGGGAGVHATGVSSFAGTAAYTVTAWVRPASADGQYRFIAGREWRDAAGRQGTGVWLHASGLGFERWRDGVRTGVTAAVVLPADRFTLVAATYDGVTMRLLVDGRQVGSRAAPDGLLPDDGRPFVIGSLDGTPTNAWRGGLDEVAVYPAAVPRARLAAQEAAARRMPCTDVEGATGRDYAVARADVGFSLRAVTRAVNAAGARESSTGGGVIRTREGQPFTLELAEPSADATVRGDVEVVARLAGMLPDRVQWLVDGVPAYEKAGEPPFAFRWRTAFERNGGHELTVRAWRTGRPATAARAVVTVRNPVDPFADPLPNGPESAYAELNEGDLPTANDLLADVWPARGFPPPHLAWPLTWREDPYADAYWRFVFYGLRPTSHLLWAWERTGRRAYLDKLLLVLRSYAAYDATRPFDRLTFDNNHAAAYRAMVLVNTYAKLERDGELPVDLARGLTASLGRLGAFLADPAHFEPAFNHGFNEALALLLVAYRHPDLPGADGWRTLARERLLAMLATNLDADGVDVENSPFYHLYVLGMVGQIAAWARDHDPALADAYDAGQRRMLRHMALVTQPDGRLPMLGATATTMVPTQDPNVYRPMTALNEQFAFVYTRGAEGVAPDAGTVLFPDSGLFLLRSPLSAVAALPAQTFVTFDAGRYRTDHSHLDALSITLYANSTTLLPDSGLFTYEHGLPEFAYFHGTRAHNTVVIDGLDQAEGDAVPGPYGTGAGWSWVSGTSDLVSGTRHTRTVVVVARGLVLVLDRVASGAPRTATQTWHLFPGATASAGDDGRAAIARNVNGAPALAIVQSEPAGPPRVLSGVSGPPMQGWYSNAYGSKRANLALEYDRSGTAARFATLLAAGSYAGSGPTLTETPTAGGSELRVCAGTAGYVVSVRGEGTSAETVSVTARACPAR